MSDELPALSQRQLELAEVALGSFFALLHGAEQVVERVPFIALVDALSDGGCVRRLRCQKHATAANTTTRRQPPSARPMARPGPASCAVTESLEASMPAPGGSGDGRGGEGRAAVGVARGRAA
eukprot:scaffold80296_cov48-Phaeocystis_antarctica.AAC.2